MTPAEVALSEYGELKSEQRERIKSRDGLAYTTLASIVAVIIGVAQTHLGALLFALAPACAILGWTRLRNDAHVVEIRRYIRDTLSPVLSAETGCSVLMWETGGRLRGHRYGNLIVDLALFVVPGVAAVATWAVLFGSLTWYWPLFVAADLTVSGVTAFAIFVNVGLEVAVPGLVDAEAPKIVVEHPAVEENQ